MGIIALPSNSQITGIRSGTHADILRIQDIDPNFVSYWDQKQNALLYRMLMSLRKGSPVHDPTHTWFEDDKPPTYTTVHTQCTEVAGTGKTLVITDHVAIDNTTLYDESTGEWLMVTASPAVTSAGGANDGEVSLTVTRGYAGTTAAVATLPVGRKLRVGPTLLAEGDDANSGIMFQPSTAYNYATYFSESCTVTDVQMNSMTRNGVHDLDDSTRITILRLMEQMDTQLRYGKRLLTSSASDGKNLYHSNGFEAVAGNAIALQGTELDWVYLNEQLNVMWDTYTGSSPEKVMLCGPALFDAINKTAYDKWNVRPTFEATLGAIVAQINLTSGGQLSIIRDNWGFKESTNKAFIIDMNYASVHEHAGMELQRRDISKDESHQISREIYGSILPVFKLPNMHGIVTWTQN